VKGKGDNVNMNRELLDGGKHSLIASARRLEWMV